MRVVFKLAGVFSVICGGVLLFVLFGFASMSNPDASTTSSLGQMVGHGLFPVGVLLIAAGVWLAFSEPRRSG